MNGLNDPLPVLECDIPVESLDIGQNKINYKRTLKDYIVTNGIEEGTYYENASSSLTIKKCLNIDYIEHSLG